MMSNGMSVLLVKKNMILLGFFKFLLRRNQSIITILNVYKIWIFLKTKLWNVYFVVKPLNWKNQRFSKNKKKTTNSIFQKTEISSGALYSQIRMMILITEGKLIRKRKGGRKKNRKLKGWRITLSNKRNKLKIIFKN